MKDQKYWQRRAVRYERDWNKRCAETVEKRLARHYKKALSAIKDDILQLYATFAKDNGLDFNEARRALSSREFREWRMSMNEYIAANNAGLTKELNALAMSPRITRLEKLYGETLQELDRMGRKVNDDMRNFLSDAYKSNYSRDIFDLVKAGGMSVAWGKVDSPSVEKVLAARWSGKNYSQRIWTNTRLLSRVVRETVAIGVHRGLSVPQLSRMIEDKMHAGYANAVRLVQTEMSFVNNQAHADSMEAAGIAWYEFIAVLDNRTSAPCRSRDGETYPLEEKTVGFNYPPLHPRCRSTVAPFIDGVSKSGTRIAKVGKDTIHIPASMSYRDYETVYVKKTQTFEQWQSAAKSKAGNVTKPKAGKVAEPKAKNVAEPKAKNVTEPNAKNAAKSTTILQNPTQNGTINTLKEQIEPLRQKLEQQKASGASVAEMEQTVKAAGKIIVREVKGLKIYDVSLDKRFTTDLLSKTFDDFEKRVYSLGLHSPERKELLKILNKMEDELFALDGVVERMEECSIFQERSKQITSILSQVRDLATPEQAKMQFKTRSVIKPLMDEVLLCYPAEWVDNSIKASNIRLRIVERGYYDDKAKRIGAGFYNFDTGVHEFGHRMEDVLKGLKEMERAFYQRRTKGEKLQKLRDLCPANGYSKKELTRKDKFLDPYMGKTYRGQAYELVSMGFENAYTNPEFLLQDEDMAEWIYGLLAVF